ncbi:MAG: hypothetical protein H0X39_18620 [Actinobacteria bacterium]|nr:hypothetical protein [Actinomycetota bacterium]
MNARDRVRVIVTMLRPEPVELLVGCFTTIWGLWFAAPWSHSSVPVLVGTPRWAVGLPLAALGVAKLVILLRGSLRQRFVVGMMMTAAWAAMCAMYIYASWSGQSTVVYPFVVLAAGWAMSRIGRSLNA